MEVEHVEWEAKVLTAGVKRNMELKEVGKEKKGLVVAYAPPKTYGP